VRHGVPFAVGALIEDGGKVNPFADGFVTVADNRLLTLGDLIRIESDANGDGVVPKIPCCR
jgi:hypothetical protein